MIGILASTSILWSPSKLVSITRLSLHTLCRLEFPVHNKPSRYVQPCIIPGQLALHCGGHCGIEINARAKFPVSEQNETETKRSTRIAV